MVVLFIVGSVFTLFGFTWVINYRIFLNEGRQLPAKVIGIERYTSKGRRGSRNTFYRPIIEYSFNGQKYSFSSQIGSSDITHKINEKVQVLSLNKGPEYVRLKNRANLLFPAVFLVIGLGLITAFFFQNPSFELTSAAMIIESAVFFFIYNKLKKMRALETLRDSYLKTKILSTEELSKKKLLRSNREIEELVGKSYRIAFGVTLLFLAGLLFGAKKFFEKLRPKTIESLQEVIENPELWEKLKYLNFQREPELVGLLILSTFSLLLIYSLLYQFKKITSGAS